MKYSTNFAIDPLSFDLIFQGIKTSHASFNPVILIAKLDLSVRFWHQRRAEYSKSTTRYFYPRHEVSAMSRGAFHVPVRVRSFYTVLRYMPVRSSAWEYSSVLLLWYRSIVYESLAWRRRAPSACDRRGLWQPCPSEQPLRRDHICSSHLLALLSVLLTARHDRETRTLLY